MHPTDLIGVFAPRLAESGADWMVVGGVAVIACGEPRFTQDLDIVAAIDPVRAAEFAAVFPTSAFYRSSVEVIGSPWGSRRAAPHRGRTVRTCGGWGEMERLAD